jgi:N-acetyl-anhydromuramyl-L-alanine amidase AmpD
MNIKQFDFPESQYYATKHAKTQIYLHHTAGRRDANQVFRGWASDPVRVATCVSISGDGTIVQGFSSAYWAYHLGLKSKHFQPLGLPYKDLNKGSIGVEICAAGSLKEKDGKFVTWYGAVIPKEDVVMFDEPYNGSRFFEKYTDEQIKATEELLVLWRDRYGIPITYNEDMWEISKNALSGKPGVWSHTSVRNDKSDIMPQPEMVQMLKSLK